MRMTKFIRLNRSSTIIRYLDFIFHYMIANYFSLIQTTA